MNVAARWMARRGLASLALVAAGACALLALIEGVERGASLGGGPADWLALVAWRIPLLGREILPILAAAAAALCLSLARRRGELLALSAAGVAPLATTVAVALGVGLPASLGAVGLELATPTALDRAAELEARLAGRSVSVGGGWATLDARSLIYIGAAEPGGAALTAVTLARGGPGGLEARFDADALRWDGEAWAAEGGRWTRTADLAVTPADQLELPPPEAMAALAERRSPSELGLLELLPGGEGRERWLAWRLGGLVAPLLAAAAAAAAAIWLAWAPPAMIAAAAAGAGLWQLSGLAALESSPPGGPGALMLAAAALLLGLAARRG